MADSGTGPEKIKDECRSPCSNTSAPKIERIDMLKEHRIQPKRAPCDQNWNNLSNEMNNVILEYKAKYKINIHESVLT